MYPLKWKTCGDDGHWCSFDTLKLSTVKDQGVYVIWYAGNPSRVVRVGQGEVAVRLAEHRNDLDITQHRINGPLKVTWADVPVSHRNGVERYLANRYSPLVGDAYPDVPPIVVNLPGE
jgi:hypothetical protein